MRKFKIDGKDGDFTQKDIHKMLVEMKVGDKISLEKTIENSGRGKKAEAKGGEAEDASVQ